MKKFSVRHASYRNILFLFFIVILIVIAAFKPIGLDRDSAIYYQASLNTLFDIRWIEPTFSLISSINNYLFASSGVMFFMMYAVIALSLKYFAFINISRYLYSSLFLYATSYFLLLELTQIRAAVATGFFLLAISDIVNNRMKRYFIKILFAISFHYSALIYLFVYFINSKSLSKIYWFLLPFLAILISGLISASLLLSITPDFLNAKISNYLSHSEKAPLFNLYRLILLFIYLFFVLNSHRIKDEIFIVSVKLLGISLTVYYIFMNLSEVFSVRFSGMISIIIVILIPFLFQIIKQKILAYLAIISYGIINLYYLLYIQRLFNF